MNSETNPIELLQKIEEQVRLAQASISSDTSPFEVYLAPPLAGTSAVSFAVLVDVPPSNPKTTYYIWGWLKALGLPAFVVPFSYYSRPQLVEMAIATNQMYAQNKAQ